MNPDLDLTLRRVLRAPRTAVWKAWTDPARFERWWIPAPTLCRVDRLEPHPGGAARSGVTEAYRATDRGGRRPGIGHAG